MDLYTQIVPLYYLGAVITLTTLFNIFMLEDLYEERD